jgi:hypothetical protein
MSIQSRFAAYSVHPSNLSITEITVNNLVTTGNYLLLKGIRKYYIQVDSKVVDRDVK